DLDMRRVRADVPGVQCAGGGVDVLTWEPCPRAQPHVEPADRIEYLTAEHHVCPLDLSRVEEHPRRVPFRDSAEVDADGAVPGVVEHGASGGEPNRRVGEHSGYVFDVRRPHVAVVIGERHDLTGRRPHPGITG